MNVLQIRYYVNHHARITGPSEGLILYNKINKKILYSCRVSNMTLLQVLHSQCFLLPGHYWNVPVVGVSTSTLYPWMHDFVGNPENWGISSNNLYDVSTDFTSFWTRLHNAYLGFYSKFMYQHFSREQDAILKTYYGPAAPSIQSMERSVSMILVNSHFSISGIQPSTAGLIEVGGLHIQNDGPELNSVILEY